MVTYQYRQYINGINDSVDVVTTIDGIEITKNVPMNLDNSEYKEIKRLVDAGELTIQPADEE